MEATTELKTYHRHNNVESQESFDMNIELWKDIEGYEGYSVSNQGRVKSKKRNILYKNGTVKRLKETILKAGKGKFYLHVVLHSKKKRKTILIHRLVAKAFAPNYFNKKCVNHIDGDKHNNSSNNLEWVSYRENELHSIHVLGKTPKVTNLQHVECANKTLINGRLSFGVKIKRIYDLLIKGAEIRASDTHLGNIYSNISTLKIKYGVNISKRRENKFWKVYYLDKEEIVRLKKSDDNGKKFMKIC